jgi:16S rRNA (guanine527-N7)-methyltransferase
VTARALAPLADLLAYSEPFLRPDTRCLFLKGKSAEEELTAAAQEWKMEVKRRPSRSDPSALLLEIQGPRRAS